MPMYTCVLGRVSEKVVVSDRCTVGAGCTVDSQETLAPDTVIHGEQCHRYERKAQSQV